MDPAVARDVIVKLTHLARDLVVAVDGEWGEGRTFEELVGAGEPNAVLVDQAFHLYDPPKPGGIPGQPDVTYYHFDQSGIGLILRVAQIARDGMEWTELNLDSFENLVKRGHEDALVVDALERMIDRTVR